MRPCTTQLDSVLHEAARIATEYLQGHGDRTLPVVRYAAPDELAEKLSLSIPEHGRPMDDLLAEVKSVLDNSVRTGHPHFLNQLFGGYEPAAILGDWMAAVINTSMYTFESAPIATLLERTLIARMNELVGFTAGEGVFAPGGSISNLMAVLTARHKAFPHVKREGLRQDDRPVMFLSAEAHYSLYRAAAVAGIGVDAAISVPTDEAGRMRPEELERRIEAALAEGRRPFLVAATAGTTVPGAFDPIAAIADVTQRHGLWLHVDASYGGSVLLSRKRRSLMVGVERADSVVWNPHKMMGMPLACSATLMRKKGSLLATNGMNADYLFHGDSEDSIDLGDLSLQCGRRVDALKLWLTWQALGNSGYEARVDELFEKTARFRAALDQRLGFRVVREPQGTNVCFRYLPTELRDAPVRDRTRLEDEATRRIRERLVQRGRFLVNYATLDGAATFRAVVCNPRTTLDDLDGLLGEIEYVGTRLYGRKAGVSEVR